MAAYYIMTNYGPMSIQGLKRMSDDKINEILKDAPKDMDTFQEVYEKYSQLVDNIKNYGDSLAKVEAAEALRASNETLRANAEKQRIDAEILRTEAERQREAALSAAQKTITDALATKTEKVCINIVGTTGSYQFKKGDKVLNFQELNDMLQNSPDFLVFVHGNREYRCTFIDLSSNPKQMRFVAPLLNDGVLKTQSFYVTSIDGVAMTSITSGNINCENGSNKRDNLNNPNNTTYPTTKAVADELAKNTDKISNLEKELVNSFEDDDYSFLDGATTHVLTKNRNPIKPMTDFNSVFDADGKSLTEFESGIIYDVSSHNGGVAFESLSALLGSSNLSTLIPTSVRHGGMSIRFIQGSEQSADNKYVQYFLTKDDWSTTESDWEKINLEDELNHIDTIVNGNNILDLVDVGFWNKDLSSDNSNSFKKSKIDVSAFGIIEVNGSARNNAYISLVASDDSTILWQSNNINASFKIDLRYYQQPKYLYYCYEKSVVNNPYVNVLSLFNDIVEHIHFQTGQKLNATKIINNLTTGGVNDVLSAEQGKELNTQLNGSTTIEEITITADQAGFIRLSDGAITNPSGDWKHTILVPIDSFVSVTGFINNGSVASIALYSSDRFDSYLGGFTNMASNAVITDLSPYTSQYPTARYVAFTTNTLKKTLVCKYNNPVANGGLKVEVENLENKVETLEGSIGDINEDIIGLESKVSSLRKKNICQQ